MSMLKVNQLSYEYPGLKALDDVSFEIEEKRIVALVGPNGAGKSTLFKCLISELEAVDGEIFYRDLNLESNHQEIANMFGYLPDFFGLYSDLKVRQALNYFAEARLIPKNEIAERVVEIATLLNLDDKLDEEIENLSRGMKQRLAIGQVIIHYPKILFLDEPASGLDPEARTKLGSLLKKLRDEKGMSIIVSSHILAELDQYAEEIIILEKGKLIEHKKLHAKKEEDSIQLLIESIDPNPLHTFLREHEFEFKENTGKFLITGVFTNDSKADLLTKLISSDIKVTSFSEVQKNLQEEYLETLSKRGNNV